MTKIRLVTHKESVANTVETLQKMGVVELTEIKDKTDLKSLEKTVFNIDHTSSRVDFTVSFLSHYERAPFLKKLFEGGRTQTTEKEMEEIMKSFYFEDVVKRTTQIIESINTSKSRLEALQEEERLLLNWTSWETPLSFPTTTEETRTLFVEGKEEDITSAEEEIADYPNYIYQRVSNICLAVTCLKGDEKALKETLTSYKLEEIKLPKRLGTVTDELERIRKSKIKNLRLLDLAKLRANRLASFLPKLRVVSDYLHWRKERNDITYQAYGTNSCLIFEGWAPKKSIDEISNRLVKLEDLSAIEEIEPEDGEEPPIEIRNNKLVAPFESVTRLYGLPGKKDLDPTPYLAGFFFIFFGICLSDAGYGLVLTGLTALILLTYKVTGATKLFIQLFMLGGISSFVTGLFFGGYFGIGPEFFPTWIANLQYFDPVANPLPVFYLALGLGVFQIVFGICLDIVRSHRTQNLKEGLLDNVPWLIFFASVILWGGSTLEIITGSENIYSSIVLLSLVMITLSSGRKYPKLWQKISMGILGLYSIVGYLSDILSYSRLLALGLATGALAFSVNLIATMAYEAVPFGGIVVMIIILIVGHSFNLAVNLLGSFIHTARLQFVEFFGKFIKGTGRNFKPFYREERNIILKK